MIFYSFKILFDPYELDPSDNGAPARGQRVLKNRLAIKFDPNPRFLKVNSTPEHVGRVWGQNNSPDFFYGSHGTARDQKKACFTGVRMTCHGRVTVLLGIRNIKYVPQTVCPTMVSFKTVSKDPYHHIHSYMA